MKRRVFLACAAFMIFAMGGKAQSSQLCDVSSSENIPQPVFPVPSEVQIAWHNMEFYAFIHYGINTYTNKEWGYGDESINTFNPTAELDVEQWVTEIKNIGCKGIIITCKHHDGFCTWFTETTEHSTKNNTTTYGHVDIPALLSADCRRQGLIFGA